jgi:hypothetical protein
MNMPNQFDEMSDSRTWNILVAAATRALKGEGFVPERVPGRGRSNVWEIEENGQRKRISIRTTKDRWFAFQPLKKGTEWKTLDDVDIVIVAAVDDRDDPNAVEIYRFDAGEVRQRFDASYAARTQAGQTVKDNYGMWVNLDADDRGRPASVGAGLATQDTPIATYPLEELIAEDGAEATESLQGATAAAAEASGDQTHTIAEVMDWARRRIATLSGVRMEAVKLDCRIET